MRNITLLGATGSIGTQTLDVIRRQNEEFKLFAVSANKNWDKLIEIIEEFSPKFAVLMEENAYKKVSNYCRMYNKNTEVLLGMNGLIDISTLEDVDIVVTAVVGMIGIKPTLEAINHGKDIALANKETLVVAGEIIMEAAKKNNVRILPVDSEHGAIFQCLQGNNIKDVDKIILTASGGPFRGRKFNDIANIPVEEALNHPKWNMGSKISIDSATLMNKGLEVIEAHWLFNQCYEDIQVVVHPQSIIHSAVQYKDGSIIAQMASADMRLPIQYALNFPYRKQCVINKIDLTEIGKLTFEKPDMENFPCLGIAIAAGKQGGLMPGILNSANETAVSLYLNNKINFGQISYIVKECLDKFFSSAEVNLDNILDMQSKVTDYIIKKYK
ncbi:1-deoxy-D-xylulose-5-phosphate reductoisomerase [Clostridium oryzae]|uniref:1-deoxy-D-xylulose 5-phosphate reductoisomerase n=1 Tax=Clostridium oryzae TaxID=1450648 RepID=A0A1V4IPR4_9CLOT|nr:1-deoxy-D-xylulose-5-phosphate reductoisomerase [Clostridium oryzae]OPJ61804.1 1-deoxy-D-xylulose 5-phosphate reductoisomerase [Clostridium oryzae]